MTKLTAHGLNVQLQSDDQEACERVPQGVERHALGFNAIWENLTICEQRMAMYGMSQMVNHLRRQLGDPRG